MGKFILRYRGRGPKPAGFIKQLQGQCNLTVLDDSSPRMILVEAPEAALRALVDQSPEWILSREESYQLPPSHPSLDKAKDLKKP